MYCTVCIGLFVVRALVRRPARQRFVRLDKDLLFVSLYVPYSETKSKPLSNPNRSFDFLKQIVLSQMHSIRVIYGSNVLRIKTATPPDLLPHKESLIAGK